MKKSMRLRTAKKIVKVIENDGMAEAERRYGKGFINKFGQKSGRIEEALRLWKGEPELERPEVEPIAIESWEHYLEVTRKPRKTRACERYRNLKERNSKLAKLKYPWIN